jgi:hypothetical protein
VNSDDKTICSENLNEEQSTNQSAEKTRSDKPSNLIPHDKDHAGDPMEFCPDLSQRVKPIDKIFQSREECHLKTRTNPASNVKIIYTPQT